MHVFFPDSNVLMTGDVMTVGSTRSQTTRRVAGLGGLLSATKTLLDLTNADIV